MLSGKITRISLGISLTILFIMWFVFFLDYSFKLDWYLYGLYPLRLSGLIGVFTSPFLHSTADFSHILNNSLPAFALTWMLFYHYRTIATKSFLFIYFFTGIMMWLFARESYHIGMSGVIYGLTSFLVLSGFLRKNMKVAAISLAVIFYYGSMVWGIFPSKVGVSWEAHAIGLLSGILIAIYFRKSGPQPAKMIYEIEEELGFESDEEYWKAGYRPKPKEPETHPPVIFKYTVMPKKEDPKN